MLILVAKKNILKAIETVTWFLCTIYHGPRFTVTSLTQWNYFKFFLKEPEIAISSTLDRSSLGNFSTPCQPYWCLLDHKMNEITKQMTNHFIRAYFDHWCIFWSVIWVSVFYFDFLFVSQDLIDRLNSYLEEGQCQEIVFFWFLTSCVSVSVRCYVLCSFKEWMILVS